MMHWGSMAWIYSLKAIKCLIKNGFDLPENYKKEIYDYLPDMKKLSKKSFCCYDDNVEKSDYEFFLDYFQNDTKNKKSFFMRLDL
jgi:hypothetical protein